MFLIHIVELRWSLNKCISPVLYTMQDWLKYHFTPFFHNVKRRRDTIVMSFSSEDMQALLPIEKKKHNR